MARSQSYSPIASHGKVPKAITSPGGRKSRMPKIVPCNWPECEAAFSRKADMVRHLRAVHLNIKNFECPYEDCPRVFAQKSSLTSHLNVHTQAKPYACPTCERPFGDQSSCTRHWREQHDGRKFFCAWCTSSNKRRAAFRKHLIEHQVPNVKTMDLDAFLLPEHYTVDDLERLPLFHGAGMAGLEMRRKKPVTAPSSRHMLLDPALICMDRASSLDSLASTPSLSPAASPAPSSEDDSAESYAMDPSRFDFGGNGPLSHSLSCVLS
ncbi:hypothetical protein OH76DRAFT_1161354 [Lentinus brumalis]|uniref:C2H2-type domain-containing protein n=1 Tax=Lentinus brumalis TaxID=2498619 RepID=A0A371DMW6_9APHY|nr:hypothetical protein OH76DRAFT_1161354 [Polyporus brumalis]